MEHCSVGQVQFAAGPAARGLEPGASFLGAHPSSAWLRISEHFPAQHSKTPLLQSESRQTRKLKKMPELDPRKETILRAIIVEYVTTAEPIGSEALVQKYELGVRSATVRNEMAEMSELGYLEQPHTSAGRIPSDLGYRYYVDRLISDRTVRDADKSVVKQATSDGDALQELLRDTARILSRITRLLTVATTSRDNKVTVRTAVVSALGPQQALMVLVLSNGHVENRMIECPSGLTLQDVGWANEFLATTVTARNLRTLSRLKTPPPGTSQASDKLIGLLCAGIRQACRDLTRGKVISEGEEFMFSQPEFSGNATALSDILDRLTQSEVLHDSFCKRRRAGSDDRTGKPGAAPAVLGGAPELFCGDRRGGDPGADRTDTDELRRQHSVGELHGAGAERWVDAVFWAIGGMKAKRQLVNESIRQLVSGGI